MLEDLLNTVLIAAVPMIGWLARKFMKHVEKTDASKWLSDVGIYAAAQRVYDQFRDEIKDQRIINDGQISKELIQTLQDAWYRELMTIIKAQFGFKPSDLVDITALNALREIAVTELKGKGLMAKRDLFISGEMIDTPDDDEFPPAESS